jgi:hypothetical protein
MASIGQSKVFALRARLLTDYPHLHITAIDKSVQTDDASLRNNLTTADLVICTTADPECELHLMAQLRARAIPSMLLAWSEPHALAGHSAHSFGDQHELELLFEAGRCLVAATEWPKSQSKPLPGCGESHIPGAGNRIRIIAGAVAEHALDVLLNDGGIAEHRIRAASSHAIDAYGGKRLLPTEAGPTTSLVRAVPSASSA